MRIALLDDDPRENENLSALIGDFAARRNYDISCETFTSGRESRVSGCCW